MANDGWRWKPRPDICAEIQADIEADSHDNIGDQIEEALKAGNAWRANSLRRLAQQEFDFMVKTNGECPSLYADVRDVFKQYSALEGYQPHDRQTELEKHFDVTTNPETGQLLIHPKGMMS